jgi:hypothetical protein
MSTTYLCKKCNYQTVNYYNLKKHINIKKSCPKNYDALNYSDDELLVLTLLPYFNKKHILDTNEIDYLKNSNFLHKNKDELFKYLNEIDDNKTKKCNFCNKEFQKLIDLRKHILLSCFYEKMQHNKSSFHCNDTNTYNINSNNIINNTTNIINNNINNNINNINIYFNIKNPIPFDEDWDLSKIDNKTSTELIFSKLMYTRLLKELLNNEINLNVIIDKDNKSGIVYKNDIDKYIKMKTKDIVDNTMEKLNKYLIDMNSSDKESFPELIDFSRKMIKKKHIDYTNNGNIQNMVEDLICDIFETKKKGAIEISKNIISETDSLQYY